MAFSVRDFGVMAYTMGVTQWTYKTNDDLYQVMATGYFDDAADMVAKGDLVHIVCKEGTCFRAFTGNAGQLVPLLA